jgi:hypothetical protein
MKTSLGLFSKETWEENQDLVFLQVTDFQFQPTESLTDSKQSSQCQK